MAQHDGLDISANVNLSDTGNAPGAFILAQGPAFEPPPKQGIITQGANAARRFLFGDKAPKPTK